MKTIEYHSIDKSNWIDGEWKNEPDKVQWQDEETKLPCLIVRHFVYGNLCGYVGISEEHPFFKKDYSDLKKTGIRVHGGLNFSNVCQESDDDCHGICHVPDENEPDQVWWLGFDCGHAFDLKYISDLKKIDGCYFQHIGNVSFAIPEHSAYRNIDYVKEQCKQLARQLHSYHLKPETFGDQ